MLATAKRSLTILVKLQRRKHSWEIFEGEMFIRTLITTLLQVFRKLVLNFQNIVISIDSDNFEKQGSPKRDVCVHVSFFM